MSVLTAEPTRPRYADPRTLTAVHKFESGDPRRTPQSSYQAALARLPLKVDSTDAYSLRLRSGSMVLEAAAGAPHYTVRRKLARTAESYLEPLPESGAESATDYEYRIRAGRLLSVAALYKGHSLRHTPYQERLRDQLGDIVSQAEMAEDPEGDFRMLKGLLTEQTMLSLLHNPDKGLMALPSWIRQDRGSRLIDDKKYAWDITLESDGTIIDPGQYRIQAKSKYNKMTAYEYHPDIAVLGGADYLGGDAAPGSPYEASLAIVRGEDTLDYKVALLGALSMNPPASRELAYAC